MAVTQADLIKARMNGLAAASVAPQGETAPAEQKKPTTFEGWVETMLPAIGEALPPGFTKERFARMILTNYKASPDLQNCTPKSVLGAALQAAQLGLMIGNLGQAYLVPYGKSFKTGRVVNGKPEYDTVKEAQLQIGYKGFIELGYRTGKISHIRMEAVYKDDFFDFEYGTEEFLKHKQKFLQKEGENPTHYYVVIHQTDGQQHFLVRSRDQIVEHAKKYTNYLYKGKINERSTWFKSFDAMALKTVIREIYKTVQLTTDVMLAVEADGSVKHVDENSSLDNMAENTIDLRKMNSDDEEPEYGFPEEPAAPAPAPAYEPIDITPKSEEQPKRGVDPGPTPPPATRRNTRR